MEQLLEMLETLGIEWQALLLNIISFVLLVWLMKRFLFKPVGQFVDGRQKQVTAALDEAETERSQAAAARADVDARRGELLEAAGQDAQGVRQAAGQEAEEIRRLAREAARSIELSAKSATEREVAAASKMLRGEVGSTASAMATRVLRDALTEERHRALLDQFIADVERMAAGAQAQQ
jgi:F-type H+-transporting ATPase subunit b